MNLRPLPKELQVIAETELNEVPARIEDDIKSINTWLKTQSHLNARNDDQWILTFLRACKFSLERTKEKLDKFLAMRALAPEYFRNRDPFASAVQYSFDNCIISILPSKNGEHSRCIVRVGARDPNLMTFEDVIRIYFMFCDILLEETDNSAISGTCLLLDFKDVTYAHAIQVTLPLLKKALMCFEGSYPIRAKALYLINAPAVVMPFYRLLRTLLSKKLTDRVYLFENDGGDALFKHFPKDILPEEYGGDGKSLRQLSEEWKTKMESYQTWFVNDEQYCSDETKRPKDSKTCNELLGISGSFRKLDVD